MSSGPQIFDRRLLRARQTRARALGPATFLLDRVAGELAERLSAVLRRFDSAVDLGTPTDAVRRALAASGNVGTIIAAEFGATTLDRSFLRVAADEEALAVRRWLARSGRVRAGAAICQRSARDTDPNPPRAEAGRVVAGGVCRRRQPGRIARGYSPPPKARSRAASRRALRRLPMCANLARFCSAPALRCRSSTASG